MQQEDVFDELRKIDDYVEEQIVHEVSLSNLIVLENLGLVGKEADENKCHWYKKKRAENYADLVDTLARRASRPSLLSMTSSLASSSG